MHKLIAVSLALGSAGFLLRAEDLDERLYNTFYLEGDTVTFVVTIQRDGKLEVTGPGGEKASGTINATKREIGFLTDKGTRHFAYGFEGDDLLLMGTRKDTPSDSSPTGKLEPTGRGEIKKYLSKAKWMQLHPGQAAPGGAAAGGDPAEAPSGEFSALDAAGRTHRLQLKEDKRFVYTAPDGGSATGIFTYNRGELSLYSATQQRLLFVTRTDDGIQMVRREADIPKATDVLGGLPPTDRSAVRWRPGAAPVGAPAVAAAGGSGLDDLLEIERTQGAKAAQGEADYRLYMAAGDRALLYGRYDEAKRNYEYAQGLKPGAAAPREALRQLALREGGGSRWTTRPRIVQPVEPVAGGEADTARVLEMIRQGRTEEALTIAANEARIHPGSMEARELKAGVEEYREVQKHTSSLDALLKRSRSAADDVLRWKAGDPSAEQVRRVVDGMDDDVAALPGRARESLLRRDYAGVSSAMRDSRSKAGGLAAQLESVADWYGKKAKDEDFKGVDLGIVRVGVEDKDEGRGWRGHANTFRALADESKTLSR